MIFICILNLMIFQINPIITWAEIDPKKFISNGTIINMLFYILFWFIQKLLRNFFLGLSSISTHENLCKYLVWI